MDGIRKSLRRYLLPRTHSNMMMNRDDDDDDDAMIDESEVNSES